MNVSAQDHYSEKVAATVMNTWKDSFSLGNGNARWAYDMGVILKGFEGLWMNTGNGEYFNYIQKQMDYFVDDSGNIKTYHVDEYNIDNINNGKLLLLLYRVTEKEKYLRAAKLLRTQLQTHPRTNEGGFWHKKIYPSQVWLDGLYMAQPFYAEYALVAHEDTAFHDIARQFIAIEKHTRDAATGLLYHGYDESRQQQWANKETGTSPLFWARAMGWYATALVDALEYFPANHPSRKSLIDILNRLVVAISKQQDPATGLWKDILNYNGEGKEKNYFEASASSQFVYAIAKGVRMQYVPSKYLAVAQKGYKGILKEFIKTENGVTNLYGTVKVSGLGGKPYRDGSFNYYMSEDVIVNDPKGIGAFLLAANEMEIVPLQPSKKKWVVLDNYYNHESRTDAFGKKIIYHYKWDEKDNNGFSMLGHVFNTYGAVTSTMDGAPAAGKLAKASVYIIVDPDFEKENPSPSFMNKKDADVIYQYVVNGGVLVLMANDSGNVEFKHFNQLAGRFGIKFNENLRHDVKGREFEQGAVVFEKNNPVFKTTSKAYIKQLCSQSIHKPATAIYRENGETLISVAKVGKGTVFAVGDPWLYNEYVDGRKLPPAFENYKAAEDLVKWLLKQSTR
jgi:unsaturated rhamnogalacturonyl hydrolase